MRTHACFPTRWLLAPALSLLCGSCHDDAPEQGELMLSITSDLAVPNDIDRLAINITLEGDTIPFAKKTVELSSGSDLPVTLAIEAGARSSSPIKIHVEARKGSAPSILRVVGDVSVVVPKNRVAQLDLPLSFLCSDASLAEPCEAGMTCRAGHCVDASVPTASLPDYHPSPAADCQDVTPCLSTAVLDGVGPITLKSGRQVACGISGTKLLGPDANVNLALQVSKERVGNYGFCGPFSGCFVPLRRDETPEGWHVLENGDTPALELPAAVCENLEKSISRVAVVRATPSCPSDRGDRPLCSPREPRGCLPAEVCPPTSPEPSWFGFACTDANPVDSHPDLLKCWSPPAPDAAGATPNDGRWCCLKGQEPSDDPLLLDDMQGGPQMKRKPPEGHFAGWWFSDIPEGSGDLSPAPEPSLYTYRQFDEPVGPPGGPQFRAAACLSSRGFRGWLAIQGFYFGSKLATYGTDLVDVSDYAGISFWGWADEPPFVDAPLPIEVTIPNSQAASVPESECSMAGDGSSRCESFFKVVDLTRTWQHYVVRWEELAQSDQDWGQIPYDEFDPKIYSIQFHVRGAGPKIMSQPFDFCVADIRFEPKPEPAP